MSQSSVFISWSGEISKSVSEELHNFLRHIFPEISIVISTSSIDAGTRWGIELDKVLEKSNFGIVTVTPGNLYAPWLLYEAGAMARIGANFVVPYCFGMGTEELVGPLHRFNGVNADKQNTFEAFWPKLENTLQATPSFHSGEATIVRVRRVLCASTPEFEEAGGSDDPEILDNSFPGSLQHIANAGLEDLSKAMSTTKFDIVHLLGSIDARTGDFLFDKDERLPPDGLKNLLKMTEAKLVFLATCDSLNLGAILSRHWSVIAAADFVENSALIVWEKQFYGLLANGYTLTKAYDTALSLTKLPMRLLIRNDATFVPYGK
jgi:hypothetical protein